MGHIARLGKSPRIYAGAIGYLAPNRHAQFSIAIRTSTVNKVAGTAQYAPGRIVWDSTAKSIRKCWQKLGFLVQ